MSETLLTPRNSLFPLLSADISGPQLIHVHFSIGCNEKRVESNHTSHGIFLCVCVCVCAHLSIHRCAGQRTLLSLLCSSSLGRCCQIKQSSCFSSFVRAAPRERFSFLFQCCLPACTWEFPSMSLFVTRSHLLSKPRSLWVSKGRMSEWKLSLVSNLFSHPTTIHPLNLQVHLCSIQQQASVKSSRRLFFTGTSHIYLFLLFLILNVRQRIRKFCSPSSSSSKCVSR